MGNENKLKKEKKMIKGEKGSPKIGKKGLVNQFKKTLSWNLKCARVFISYYYYYYSLLEPNSLVIRLV